MAIGLGLTAGLVGAAVLGVWTYARYFGGGPRVAAAGAAIKAAGVTLYRGLAPPSLGGRPTADGGRSSLLGSSGSYGSGVGGGVGAVAKDGGFNAYGSLTATT